MDVTHDDPIDPEALIDEPAGSARTVMRNAPSSSP